MRAERLHSLEEDPGAAADPGALFEALARMAVGLALGYILEDSGMYRGEEGPTADNNYQAVELRQLQSRVRALVENLPERERLIIRCHYLNLVPFESIADSSGSSKDACRSFTGARSGCLRRDTKGDRNAILRGDAMTTTMR